MKESLGMGQTEMTLFHALNIMTFISDKLVQDSHLFYYYQLF